MSVSAYVKKPARGRLVCFGVGMRYWMAPGSPAACTAIAMLQA